MEPGSTLVNMENQSSAKAYYSTRECLKVVGIPKEVQ